MYVISGANGHVGSVAARALLKGGHKVRVIVHSPNKRSQWEHEGAQVAIGSVEDEAFLAEALKGATAFFAMLPPNFSTPDYFAWQCKAADAHARAVRASGCPYVVMLSSVGAHLKEGTGPIKGLHYFEEALLKTGVKLARLRPGYFQENIGSVIGAVESAHIYPNFLPSPDFRLAMVATHDIGEIAAQELLNAKSEIIDIVGPSYSASEIAKLVNEALGQNAPIVQIPAEDHVQALVQAGVPSDFAKLLDEMHHAIEQGLLVPCGDRTVRAQTPIDVVIHQMTAHHHPMS